MSEIREMENFIIQQCVYPGLLDCRFDQQKRELHVLDVHKRDVPASDLPALAQGLEQMCAPPLLDVPVDSASRAPGRAPLESTPLERYSGVQADSGDTGDG